MPTLTASITITTIPTQQAGVSFPITGTITYSPPLWTDDLVYEDDGGVQHPISSAPITLTPSSWSWTHTGMAIGSHTVSFKDPLTGTIATSNTFQVVSPRSILPSPVTGVVANTTFIFAGALNGYATAPSLTYQVGAGPLIPITGVTSTGWSMSISLPTAGTFALTVSDGMISSAPLSVTVAPVTAPHTISITVPGSVTAGATYTFAGTLGGYASAPSLTYVVNNGIPVQVTGVTAIGWSMQVVAPAAAGSYNIAVTDGTTSAHATLVVTAIAKVITPIAPAGVVAGQSFTFNGLLSGYLTIPALTYTISPGGSPVAMTGVSVSGWSQTVTVATGGTYTITVSDGTNTSVPVSFSVTAVNVTLRDWSLNPGMDGSFWVQPFQSSSNWITSGSLITALRGGTPSVNITGNFSPPTYRGVATDPLVTITDGSHTIVVHLPIGATVEGPPSIFDQSVGGVDSTQPYLLWSISGATIRNSAGSTISAITGPGCTITGTYGFAVQDGSGLIMVDAVTGAPGDNNTIGGIQSYELAQITADPNYIIQHMLAFQLDSSSQASQQGPIWPLKLIDVSNGSYSGPLPQGITIGIPANVSRPTGQTRAFYALWDCMQQFGAFNYNFGGTGGVNIEVCDADGTHTTLVNALVTAWPSVASHLCILNYDPAVSGSQFSLATTKGAIPGSTNAFPAPAPLDLSPTGGKNVAPSTFGAWYPSGYNAIPTNSTTSAVFIVSPTAPSGVVVNTSFTFAGVLSGYATAPVLTYSINGAAPVNLPGVTATGWSAPLTVAVAGATTVVVNDATNVASGSVSFNVTATAVTNIPVTWNPAGIQGGIALSAANYTATATGSGTAYSTPQGVIATSAVSGIANPILWEVTLSAVTQNTAVGIADSTAVLNVAAGMGWDTNSIGFYPSTGTGSQPAQTVYFNSMQLSAGNGVASVGGAVLTFVVNGTNLFASDAAMRSTSGVSWNSNASANPITGAGGMSFTGIVAPFYPAYSAGEGGSIATLNDGTMPLSSFAIAYLAANPSVQTLSGFASTTPAKSILPNTPVGVITGAPFTFSGALTGYAAAPTLTYQLNGGTPTALTGVNQAGWSSTLVTNPAGNNTLVVSDGTISATVNFTASVAQSTGGSSVVGPLTGTVTKGTWALGLKYSQANSPSGLGYMQYNVLPPAQYDPTKKYAVLFVGHPNDSGMNGSSYPRDPVSFTTGAAYGGSYSLDTMYNSTQFRTAYPCFVVAWQIDQSIDTSGANPNANGGGYNDSQNSGWNEQAENGIYAAVVSQYPIDTTRSYMIGYSLGGITTLAQLADNNKYNGPSGLKQWTAGITYSDQLFRPSTPNSSIFARMASVPLLTISTTSDNVPASYDQPAWQTYTGNSNYPTKATYDSGGMAAIRAGTTQYYYINYGSANPATTFMPMNALGGDGDKAYTWLFSQVFGGTGPAITGATFTPAATVTANSPVGTVAGSLAAGASGGSLTGITFALSSTAQFAISGSNVVFNSGTVAAGTYPLTVSVTSSNASNSPQNYGITILVATTGSPPGIFSIAGGKVIKPDGTVLAGRGICILDSNFTTAVTNAACQPLTTQFPGVNMVRLAAFSKWSPSTYAQQIQWLTAQKIVVCIENHLESNGATGGGGQGVVYTGSLLAAEQTWYSNLATAFINNTYVWFGTCNEPPIDPSLAALWQWQGTTYNTIRATGSKAIVEIEQYNPYLQGSNSGLANTVFSQMTGIVFGPHYYSWIWGGNGSTVVPQATIYNGAIGSPNAQYGGIVQQIHTLQTLTSRDGIVPVGCFEFGPSTTGTGIDASGQNCVNAVVQAVDNGNLFGYMAWYYGNLYSDNLLDGSNNPSSPYGKSIAADMKANPP